MTDISGPVAPTNIDNSARPVLATMSPALPSRSMPGIFAQVMDDDEDCQHQLQQRIRKLHHQKRAGDSADHASHDEGHGDVETDIGALVPGAAGVGAELHGAVHRDQGGDGHEQAHQRQHGDAAADAEIGRQRRGEEAGDSEQQRCADAYPFRQEIGERCTLNQTDILAFALARELAGRRGIARDRTAGPPRSTAAGCRGRRACGRSLSHRPRPDCPLRAASPGRRVSIGFGSMPRIDPCRRATHQGTDTQQPPAGDHLEHLLHALAEGQHLRPAELVDPDRPRRCRRPNGRSPRRHRRQRPAGIACVPPPISGSTGE